MSATEICDLTIDDLSRKIAAGELSPVEVTDAHLARIDALNPAVNAFTTVAHERASAEAKLAEEEVATGKVRGPLHGVPIGVKDIIDTAGVRTTQGSSFYRDNVPAQDAECVRRLRDAGAVMIGKCNTAEFAAESATKNPHHGACRNPWDLTRVPAGSSGGSGAAVAARMAPSALGTDTRRIGAGTGGDLRRGGLKADLRADQPARRISQCDEPRPCGTLDADGARLRVAVSGARGLRPGRSVFRRYRNARFFRRPGKGHPGNALHDFV